MQQISPGYAPSHMPPIPNPAIVLPLNSSGFPPHAMAQYLRRTSGSAAHCFARAMHEDSAWANQDWGDYWADVMRLV